MTRRKQVSDRLHPPPAQPMMRKEPYASHLSWGFRLFRSSFSCLGSSGSLLSLPLRLTSLTLLAPLIIRAAGEWNEPKGTEGERSETRDGWLARARVLTFHPSFVTRSEPGYARWWRTRWERTRDEDKNAIHLSRLSILSLPFGAEGGPEAEPNGERMG